MTPQKPSNNKEADQKTEQTRTTTRSRSASQDVPTSISARMVCNQVATQERAISLAPVEDQTEENDKTYREGKGSGQVYLSNVADETLRMFKLGEEYTVEITPASE